MSHAPKSQNAYFPPRNLALAFLRLGWIGFGVQSFLGIVPILIVLGYAIFKWEQSEGTGLSLGVGLSILCLMMLMFSIYWCFRYTQLAHQLERREFLTLYPTLVQTLRLGLWTNIGIMGVSVLIALIRVGELTLKLLTLPQGATVIAPNQLGTTLAMPGALITPSSLIAIQGMLNVIAAGLVGMIVALRLLFRVERSRSTSD